MAIDNNIVQMNIEDGRSRTPQVPAKAAGKKVEWQSGQRKCQKKQKTNKTGKIV